MELMPIGGDRVDIRLQRELKKAHEKYSEIALNPSGHPDKDIFDYAINELVGLVRYGEMIQNRAAELEYEDESLLRTLQYFGRRIASFGEYEAGNLINMRSILLLNHVELGEPESR